MKILIGFTILAFLLSACVVTDRCSVKINKKKFEYYNKLQFGSQQPMGKKKRGR